MSSRARTWQQARLWLYLGALMASIFFVWYGYSGSFWMFVVIAVAMALPYVEWCGACGKIVWLEKFNKFGPLWIGRTCKDSGREPSGN